MYQANKECGGYGVFYGDDLLQRSALATAVCLDARIVQLLGYFAPPLLTHLFADNFWMDLGRELGTLKYFPNIIFEHLHPHLQKTRLDEMYVESNSFFQEDQIKYEQYISNGDFAQAIQIIQEQKSKSL
jgi:hypothetical protein